jgi:dipeptidyl aminopeptidase/acylaminoacyl peptidase
MRGGEAAPYDLKVLPAVDESKIPGAVPPPGAAAASAADKSSDVSSSKTAEDKKTEKKPDAAPEPLPLDVGGFAPSPDGKWLVVWGRDPETPGEKKQKDAKADASWVNHELHGTRLYLAALKADGSVDGVLKTIGLAPDVHQAIWSPLSDRLLAITEEPNEASDLGPAGAAWLVSAAAPDKPVKLAGVPATVGHGAAWRPDGAEIVFPAQTPEDAPPGYEELFALTVDGAASPRRLTAGFAGQLNGPGVYVGNDALVTEAGAGTRLTPMRIALEGGAAPTAVDLGTAVVAALNTNRKQTGWVWLANGGGEPEKLCFAAKLGDPCQAAPTPELAPEGLRWVAPQLVRWPAKSGGLTIEGLLYLPPESGSSKVPLIVDVHGGPFGAFEDRNDALAAFLVGHGWAILRPNPRGSSNYGTKFAAANKNDLGGGDYQDVMAGVDAVLAKYPLDPDRMALMGYSYGGEMAAFVEGKTGRFKAIISGAPVIDQFSEYGTEGGSWYDRWYFGKPWEHLDDAWKQSPLAGAAHAKTPFMLIQGQSDTTDPLGQSEEMYRALRQEGVPVELVTYPREVHDPLPPNPEGSPNREARPSGEAWLSREARSARFSVEPVHVVQPRRISGPLRRHGQHDEALAPVPVLAARRIADNPRRRCIAFLKCQPSQSAHNGLQLVMVGWAVGGEGNQGLQRSISLGQVADLATALGGQRFQSQRLPRRMRIALHQHALRRLARLVLRFKPPPASPAQPVVHIQAELRKPPVGAGLDHPRQPRLGRCIQLPFAHAGMQQPIGARFPCLRPIQQDHPNIAHSAEVVQPPSQDVGVHWAILFAIRFREDNLAGNCAAGRLHPLSPIGPIVHIDEARRKRGT